MQPYKYVIRLTGKEKQGLRQLRRRATTEVRLADRARILLWAHDGVTIEVSAARLECGRDKVIFWRRRFLEGRAAKMPVLERLRDQPRSGRPASFSPQDRETVVLRTLAHYQAAREQGVLVCSSRDLAQELSQGALESTISASTLLRLWDAMALKPWQWHYWLAARDPELVAKSRAICRLYHSPPADGTLLCLDEKPGIQILERRLLAPLWLGQVAHGEFEYVRHGRLDLFAVFEVRTGKVHGRCYPHHRAVELVDFLDYLDWVFPQREYGVLHLIADNLKTHTAPDTRDWMAQHPGRVLWHFLPKHASWLNQIEIWFSVLQRKGLKHGSWCSYRELEQHILRFIRTHNQEWAHPYRWTYKGLPLAA